ncbi:STAS domain-containing protein [Oceanimonas pelagia]|uniref:Anti-sigma factor antagonist n=1 Tax=Oceanimonas pelagia TaxID=3028314 RepID=A0AA50KMS6_9GAMM|nr:STAS domain-containing protein [Oceanimonas pelagia]WMC09830.1 STAS domain-containing protein [Oceanimonas pelagia]
MLVAHQQQGCRSLITLPARMDRARAPALRRQLQQFIEQGQRHLVLDLHQVQFVDASGLSVLLSAYFALQPHGGRLVLLSPSPLMRTHLVTARLHRLFAVYDSAESALAAQD